MVAYVFLSSLLVGVGKLANQVLNRCRVGQGLGETGAEGSWVVCSVFWASTAKRRLETLSQQAVLYGLRKILPLCIGLDVYIFID